MPLDFFGYTRQRPGAHIMSSEYAAILMSNSQTTAPSNRLGLVQGATVAYGHRVMPIFEAGSSELYWLTGQPSGTIGIERVVGDNFVAGLQGLAQPGSSSQLLNQGAIGEVDFKAGVSTINQTVLRFGGCVLSGMTWSTSVGSLSIATQMKIEVALLYPVNLTPTGQTNTKSATGTLNGTGTLAGAVGALAGAGVKLLGGSPLASSVTDGAVAGAAASLLGSL